MPTGYTVGPSMWYKGLHVELKLFKDLKNGEFFRMVWNPVAEARAPWVTRKYGNAVRDRICIIRFGNKVPLGGEWVED